MSLYASVRTVRLSVNNALHGHSVDAIASHYEEEKLCVSLEELEAQTIGNLLQDEDEDELDLISSNGGLDLEDFDSSSFREKNCEILDKARNTSFAVENPSGEHPSRTLFVRNIDSEVEDSELKALFEQFGDIDTFDRDCKHQGNAMISYYDMRAAQKAMRALQNQLFSCRKFDIHYSIPKDSPSRKGVNQGTLAVFLYDSSISNTEIHNIFNVHGDIKEIHENPHSWHHKLIEFYNFEAAEKALHDLNRNDTSMKRLKVEPSQSTDSESMIQLIHQKSSPIKPPTSFQGLHGISSSVPNTLPSLIKLKSVGIQCEITESSCSGQLNIDRQATLAFNPHSLPECRHSFTNAIPHNPLEVAADINLKTQDRIDKMQFCQVNSNGPFMDFDECVSKSSSNGSSSFPLPGHHGKWSNSYPPPRRMWPNSPSYLNGICAAPTLQKLNQLPMSPSHMISTALPINNNHVQSHPVESITPHYVDFVPHNMFPHSGLNFHNQRGMSFPGRNHMVNSFDTNRHIRSRRNVGATNLADMKRYELDIDCIIRGEDNRTTLMIKNIPNKYTSEMLLAAIDERH
ncbi:putative RNA recognition motif 2, nucleotide-binding alpha-beta plait domain-containing protein [Medicago truncatula]|uniref:Putative RNA recognition motif 2, nucleotide-binding alpha-beta plait domain-containing protein n=1 Tax=Medicago truncatula TaxID=3880 RepID=A0A396HCT9_MEDTR|nr:putative RNA recognition motif 2, nucleotide-binding alpha-beta plait domain-containing protein [Medicago truncatula]